MKIRDILDKAKIGDEIFVVRPIVIKWGSMRFENTNIIYATYAVEAAPDSGLWGTNIANANYYLKALDLPAGTRNYPNRISRAEIEYQAFSTKEEAEIWKVIELQDLEKKVDNHITEIMDKTKNKIKKLKRKEKLDDYLEKYPEKFLQVM